VVSGNAQMELSTPGFVATTGPANVGVYPIRVPPIAAQLLILWPAFGVYVSYLKNATLVPLLKLCGGPSRLCGRHQIINGPQRLAALTSH